MPEPVGSAINGLFGRSLAWLKRRRGFGPARLPFFGFNRLLFRPWGSGRTGLVAFISQLWRSLRPVLLRAAVLRLGPDALLLGPSPLGLPLIRHAAALRLPLLLGTAALRLPLLLGTVALRLPLLLGTVALRLPLLLGTVALRLPLLLGTVALRLPLLLGTVALRLPLLLGAVALRLPLLLRTPGLRLLPGLRLA